MEKQARHSEWAKRRLIGRPVMTGKALGPSSLVWVACRASPCLVHIYHDSKLRVLLRFPDDPVFMLLGPPQENVLKLDEEGSTCEVNVGSLLVITKAGYVWCSPLFESPMQTDRPAKRLKQKHLKALIKSGSRDMSLLMRAVVPDSLGTLPENQDNVWDLFEDCDIYKDIDLHTAGRNDPTLELPIGCSSSTHAQCKPLKIRAFVKKSGFLQAKQVQPEALIGKFPGAVAAAFGPQNLIAIISTSGWPILVKSNQPYSSFSAPAQGSSGDLEALKKSQQPTCVLFASMGCENTALWGGALLSERFFKAITEGLDDIKSRHLLFQGDTAGHVHIFPLDKSNQICPPIMFCDLQEPISDLAAVPYHGGSDVLLVISCHGRIVAVTVPKDQTEESLFLNQNSTSLFPRLFQIDLKAGFIIRDWKLQGPILSPVMMGSNDLYFCSVSNVCCVQLFDDVESSSLKFNGCNLGPNLCTTGKHGGSLKQSLTCQNMPIGDVIISLVGKGPFVSTMKKRPLVALTSRGRLLALEVSGEFLTGVTDSCAIEDCSRSWKCGLQKTEDLIKELVDEIAAVGDYTKALQSNIKSVNLAVDELASALRFCYDIVCSRDKQYLRIPHETQGDPSVNVLQCNLKVNPFVSRILSEQEALGHPSNSKLFSNSYGGHPSAQDFELSFEVTLSNQSKYPLSPYWTLVLCTSSLDKSEKTSEVFFSSIINEGYGLAPGAKCTLCFHTMSSEKWWRPFDVSIFICHVHKIHDELLKVSPDRSYGTSMNILKNKQLPQNLQKSNANDTTILRTFPGAVSILLARYRVDVLCFLKAQQKAWHLFELRRGLSSSVLGSYEADGLLHNLLGAFSLKVQLLCAREVNCLAWQTLNAVEKWKEFCLEDLIERCTLSKNGKELMGCDPKGGLLMVAIDKKMSGCKGLPCKELCISTSSLLSGCLVRYSLLWRILRGNDHTCCEEKSQPLCGKKRALVMDTQHISDTLSDIENRLDVAMCNAASIINTGDFADVMPETYSEVFKELLQIYRMYRDIIT